MSWTCLITGASRGIGAELAVALAKPGRTIGLNYVSSDAAAAAVAKAVEAKGAKALLLKADVSDVKAVDAMFAKLPELDALVLNAAVGPKYERLHETSPEEFERQWRVGAYGAALCVRKALPGMLKRKKGRLVFVATSAIKGAAPGYMGAYVSAKHALLGLAKAVEAETGGRGITVATAFPGMTDTDMIKGFPRPVLDAARESGAVATPARVAAEIAALVEAA